MQSIQYMAMCHEICVGKTGCLTKSLMNVRKYQITGDASENLHTTAAEDEKYADAFTTRLEIS
jgi:magnesium-transporting ATPase (P-type)